MLEVSALCFVLRSVKLPALCESTEIELLFSVKLVVALFLVEVVKSVISVVLSVSLDLVIVG